MKKLTAAVIIEAVVKSGTSAGARIGWDKRRRGSGPGKSVTPADLEGAFAKRNEHMRKVNNSSHYDRNRAAALGKDYHYEPGPAEKKQESLTQTAHARWVQLHAQYESENPGMVYQHGDTLSSKAGPRPMTNAERKERGLKGVRGSAGPDRMTDESGHGSIYGLHYTKK